MNGVIVEMLVVAMFVVVLCTKITIAKEKRLTEASQPEWITYIPSIQRVWANYTWTYRYSSPGDLYGVMRISVTVTILLRSVQLP